MSLKLTQKQIERIGKLVMMELLRRNHFQAEAKHRRKTQKLVRHMRHRLTRKP